MPVEITSIEELDKIRDDLTGHYVLAADIDASATQNWNDGAGWDPVTGFNGTLEAREWAGTITGLYIDRPGMDGVGLFQTTGTNARIEGVTLESVDIVGGTDVGALGGETRGTIEDCHASGAVTATGSVAGGLVGDHIEVGDIVRCTSSVTVDSGGVSGGLAGSLASIDSDTTPAVRQCIATGNASGGDRVGGLIGLLGNKGLVTECIALGDAYSRGTVVNSSEYARTGGVVGYADSATDVTAESITQSYAHGTVTSDPVDSSGGYSAAGGVVGTNKGYCHHNYYGQNSITASDHAGGLVGHNAGGSMNTVVEDCYWDTETSGQASAVGWDEASTGGTGEVRDNTGLTTADMTGDTPGPDGSGTMGKLDFIRTWRTTTGYPTLFPVDDPAPALVKVDVTVVDETGDAIPGAFLLSALDTYPVSTRIEKDGTATLLVIPEEQYNEFAVQAWNPDTGRIDVWVESDEYQDENVIKVTNPDNPDPVTLHFEPPAGGAGDGLYVGGDVWQ